VQSQGDQIVIPHLVVNLSILMAGHWDTVSSRVPSCEEDNVSVERTLVKNTCLASPSEKPGGTVKNHCENMEDVTSAA
jgi:hypothetical protein